MGVNIPGLIGIIVFYVLILVIGFLAARKTNKKSNNSDDLLLANRNLGFFVASFSSAATMVGGAYVNGTAESIGRDGLVWSLAPILYNFGVAIAALIYAPKVRRAKYTTIFDPIQEKFGDKMGGLLFFSELLSDLFWEAAILAALGTTLSIIMDLDTSVSIIVSACVAVFYTFFGGLYSVAYTDVIQLVCIAVGLVLSIPFAIKNPSVDLSRIQGNWIGDISTKQIGPYLDFVLQTTFGGIPWQFSTISDWNTTAYPGDLPLSPEDWVEILPMVLQYLCPVAVSVIGIGAISAAVMSSADSICLGVGSIFSKNIYKHIFRKKASEKEIIWVLRITIAVTGALGAIIAITVRSVYGLFILCGDLMYVIQFPQLTCALWVKFSNTYGSAAGCLVGLFLRLIGGVPTLKIPNLIEYPYYDQEIGQLFPFKTLSMICSFLTIIAVSYGTDILFTRDIISKKYDFFHCFKEKSNIYHLSKIDGVLANDKGKISISNEKNGNIACIEHVSIKKKEIDG